MDNVLKADNILTPAAETPGFGGNSMKSPPSTLNTDPASQNQADTFDTIPPTPQAQRPPALPYQIINSLTSTIGGMANSAAGMQGRDKLKQIMVLRTESAATQDLGPIALFLTLQ
jgi:hypothetical protein